MRPSLGIRASIRLEHREQHVVLEPHVLREVGHEFIEARIERRPAPTRVFGQCRTTRDAADFGNVVVVPIMIRPHHGDWVLDAGTATPAHRGKEDQLLLLHMRLQLSDHPAKYLAKSVRRICMASMCALDLAREIGKLRQLSPVLRVVALFDVMGELGSVMDRCCIGHEGFLS